jgi:hypothetical protein
MKQPAPIAPSITETSAGPAALPAGTGLVRPLPPGPLDIVGDVHGQIDALQVLLAVLGYSEDGAHAGGRRLVFLGDLIDRGPDSVGVMEWVARMVGAGAADCIMGNHELNLLIGKRHSYNSWFSGRRSEPTWRQVVAGEEQRQRLTSFMRSLPLAMERPDLRIAHACWDEAAIERVRHERDPLLAFEAHRERVRDELCRSSVIDAIEQELAYQNGNPLKLITSGPECRADEPFLANGKERSTARVKWWDEYRGPAFCVFGHYWRNAPATFQRGPNLFGGCEMHEVQGPGSAMCIDYSVGARGLAEGETRLAALRWPERELVFDCGEARMIEQPVAHR